MINYNVMLFDDDPLYLCLLEDEIALLNDNCGKYQVSIFKATDSRRAINLADSIVFDVFVLDICSRGRSKWRTDEYDYQGHDIYQQLLDKNPTLQYRAKFIILTNLQTNIAKKTFNFVEADYLHKQETNCKNVAQFLKSRFDSDCAILQRMKLDNLFEDLSNKIPSDASQADKESINRSVEAIRSEIQKKEPNKKTLDAAMSTLQGLKGVAEFSAALVALIQFIQSLLK